MYALTPKNIRLRYLASKAEAQLSRKAGDKAAKFTYDDMGELFLVTGQACYTWTLDAGHPAHRAPTGLRAKRVHAWINDGVLQTYLRRRGHGT